MIKIGQENINVPLDKAETYYMNMNLELLIGCKWKCKGCYVDLENNHSTNKDINNIHTLTDDITNRGMTPAILFIGPTDCFTASNTLDILRSNNVQSLAKKYLRISLLSTFLESKSKQIDDVIDILNESYAGIELEINMIIDAGQVTNENYLNLIKKNRDDVFAKLTSFEDIKTHVQFNVFDYSQSSIKETMNDYANLRNKILNMFGTNIDFNFSMGRKHNLSDKEFLDSIFTITDIFNGSLDEENIKFAEFSMGNPLDSNVERQLNFKEGHLYFSPYIYEQYVTFDSAYRIPMDKWIYSEVESFYETVTLNSYKDSSKMECGTCPYLAMCVERGVVHTMSRYNEKECILAKDAFDLINRRETLG